MVYRLKQYQETAVYDEADGLLSNTLRFLRSPKHQRLFVLKSIMGSGKTIIASEFIEAVLNSSDSARKDRELCVIWLSKGNAGLHMQSGDKLRKAIEDRDIHIYSIRDSADFNADRFYDKDVYVINWEKINNLKDGELVNNLFVDSEAKNLRSAKRNSRGVEYIFLIDEFHMNYGTESYRKIIDFFDPHVIIGMSATPSKEQMMIADVKYSIPVEDVMKEGMIKKGICFNTASDYTDDEITEYDTIDEFFLRLALRQRDILEQKYRDAGSDVIPLLLIQFNDDKNNEEIIRVKDILDREYDNNRNDVYAIWISETDNKKDRLRSPEDIISGLNENCVRILLFKQAVATGWDCPRAHVLLRYRRVATKKDTDAVSSFDVQTLGRIFRMPEPDRFEMKDYKHYDDEDLNYGYVFVPNNSYILEKEFRQAYADNSDIFDKHIIKADYSACDTDEAVEGTEDIVSQPVHANLSVDDHEERSVPADTAASVKTDKNISNAAVSSNSGPDLPGVSVSNSVSRPAAGPGSPDERARKYSKKFGAAIRRAEAVLSEVNTVASDVKPDEAQIKRAIKDILRDIGVQRDIREEDRYAGQLTFYGKTMEINDDLFDSGKTSTLDDSGTSFSISDTPAVLADKADKLLNSLIDRKQYPKAVKHYMKSSLKTFFRKQIAGCTAIDEKASIKTSKLILLNEPIIRQVIRETDDAIRLLSRYEFKKASYHFPTTFTPPPDADMNSKGIMHFPLPSAASGPEQIFEKILDRPDNNVLLWCKNMDHGKEAFCIPYTVRQELRGRIIDVRRPTYPDFIVIFTDGSIGIYEIKDHDKKDDNDAPKAEAISQTVLTMNRDIPGARVYGGLVYIDQHTQAVRDAVKFAELN